MTLTKVRSFLQFGSSFAATDRSTRKQGRVMAEESREALEGWLKTEGMHFDFLVRIEWEMQGDKLQPAE